MGKARDLSAFDKGQIVMARRLGTSISETAKLVGCSRAAVVSIYGKWLTDGETSSRRPGVGRPHLIEERGRRRLSRLVKRNRRHSIAQLAAEFNAGQSRSVSEHTVQRTLFDMGLRSRRPTKVPLLTARHRRLRLQWAREHRHWTTDQWRRVAWSDESRFLLHQVDGRVRIRRLPREKLLDQCTMGTTQAGGGSIMLWGTFTWSDLGPLVIVQNTMKAVDYLNVIADQVQPFMAAVFPNGDGLFQQDNAPCHKARIVSTWFQEHAAEFNVLSWPPNSPDINPIEHLWDVMGRRLRAHDPPPRNLRELSALCLDIWYALPADTYQKLVESMPARMAAVVRAKGGPTRF